MRKPSTALELSLVLTGLGQVYCGRIGRGLALMFLAALCLPALIVPLFHGPSMHAFCVVLVLSSILYVGTIVDAYRLAKRTPPAYQLKDYNRPYVYVLFILLFTGGAVACAFNVRSSLMQAFCVPSGSCFPSIMPGDRLLASKIAYDDHDPERGDVIIFRPPDNRRVFAVKRIVALAGDRVEIRGGQLYINEQACPRQEVGARTLQLKDRPVAGAVFRETNGTAAYSVFLSNDAKDQPADFGPFTVPRYCCFVLGDNRANSSDSRRFGPISVTSIVGKAEYLYWPVDSWSRFGRLE
ncbi:MAG: signal peptidase I [Phycisphaerae bacterium]|nr:signal peptidase I [Phycisphaerae bacterium]